MQIPKPHMTKKIAGVSRYKITETDLTPPSEFEKLLKDTIANANMAAQNLMKISTGNNPEISELQATFLQAQSRLEDLLLQQQPVQRPPNPQAAIAAYDQNKSQLGESNKMKISKTALQQIIKEELDATLQEMYGQHSQDQMDEYGYEELEEELGYTDTQHLAEEETLDEGSMMDKAIMVAKRYGVPYKAALAILAAAGVGAAGGYAVNAIETAGDHTPIASADYLADPQMIYDDFKEYIGRKYYGSDEVVTSKAVMDAAEQAAHLGSRYKRRQKMVDLLNLRNIAGEAGVPEELPVGLREGKRTKDHLTKMIMEELRKLKA